MSSDEIVLGNIFLTKISFSLKALRNRAKRSKASFNSRVLKSSLKLQMWLLRE